jgi:hypothetical protein
MSARQDLVRLVNPPSAVHSEVDWAAFEVQLGWRLPADYKWLVETYGAGSFDDFLHVLQPDTEFQPIALEISYRRAVEVLSQLKESGEQIPYGIDEIAPVAKTDNGDTVYWVRRPADDPDSWSIVTNAARGVMWPQYEGGIVEFLVAVLSKARRIAIFPDGFPSDRPTFKQYPPRRPRRQVLQYPQRETPLRVADDPWVTIGRWTMTLGGSGKLLTQCRLAYFDLGYDRRSAVAVIPVWTW